MGRGPLHELKEELNDLAVRTRRDLPPDALFVAWYLLSAVTDSETDAVDALTGPTNEGGVDAVHVDKNLKVVTLVQGKFRQRVLGRAESRGAVDNFFRWGELLLGDPTLLREETEGLEPCVHTRLDSARKMLKQHTETRLNLHFASIGAFSAAIRRSNENLAYRLSRTYGRRVTFRLVDGRRIQALLKNWLIGAAPPIESLDLPVDEDTLELSPTDSGIRTWIVSMTGSDLGRLFEETRARLFARNIRGYLGNTDINESMKKTLSEEPAHFWFYNNGITIVCDDARIVRDGKSSLLTVHSPQVINGQQTTRVLAESRDGAKKAKVLVRVLAIPSDAEHDGDFYESLISSIVRATNHQNAVKPSDLCSNDRRQVVLERQLRKLGYRYLRKREARRERTSRLGRGERSILMDEMARALGGCAKPSLPLRAGKERLFSDFYDDVFSGQTAKEALCCYWLMRKVDEVARSRDSVAWNRSKWIVLYFTWSELRAAVRAKRDAFIRGFEKKTDGPERRLKDALVQAMRQVFGATVRYYNSTKDPDDEPNRFFKRADAYPGFENWWNRKSKSERRLFSKAVSRFEAALDDLGSDTSE
jgi:hypothetical protein